MSSVFTEELFAKFDRLKEVFPTDDGFLNFLKTFKRESYTLNNKMLVYMQNPKATETNGFNAWKAKGRAVKAGEKAIYVRAMNKNEKEDKKTGEVKTRQYFGIKPVFDISQTQPYEGKK